MTCASTARCTAELPLEILEMKTKLLTGLFVFAGLTAARATLYTYDFNSGFNNGGAIPDGNPTGWSDTHAISLALPGDGTTTQINDVNVRLNISGGYNGDLYGYLVHS